MDPPPPEPQNKSPASFWNQLERCHRRLEQACDALAIAANDHDVDTARDVATFFARQIQRHEQDEDLSLFPRISKATTDKAVLAMIERLGVEHRAHEALQTRLAGVVDALSGDKSDKSDDAKWNELASIADLLARAYRDHIDIEESQLFPEARRLLSESASAEIGAEMDARRGR